MPATHTPRIRLNPAAFGPVRVASEPDEHEALDAPLRDLYNARRRIEELTKAGTIQGTINTLMGDVPNADRLLERADELDLLIESVEELRDDLVAAHEANNSPAMRRRAGFDNARHAAE